MIHIVYGTRAELIKFSTIVPELRRRGIKFELIDSGQHDTSDIRKSLRLPKPTHSLGRSYRRQWSKLESSFLTYPVAVSMALLWGTKVFFKIRKILSNSDLVITHGNTMSVPVAITAAFSLGRGGGKRPLTLHFESGFRAGTKDAAIIDKFYRIGDRSSDILFAPYQSSARVLKKEHVKGRIHITGDVMQDVVARAIKMGKKPKHKDYIVANFTRSLVTRNDIISIVGALASSPLKVLLHVNPVIERRLEMSGMKKKLQSSGNVEFMKNVSYPDFLNMIKYSSGVITDSNGVEEECAVLRKPCIVTNDFVQIPELVTAGIVRLAGRNQSKLSSGIADLKSKRGIYKSAASSRLQIGGGTTRKMADIIEELVKQ